MSQANSSAVGGPESKGPAAARVRVPARKTAAGQDLIALAQQLARDAERHALLSASLASQAERLMIAGLRQRERRAARGV